MGTTLFVKGTTLFVNGTTPEVSLRTVYFCVQKLSKWKFYRENNLYASPLDFIVMPLPSIMRHSVNCLGLLHLVDDSVQAYMLELLEAHYQTFLPKEAQLHPNWQQGVDTLTP
jgi:hypothetical protein